jgi:hypothetical protein
MDTAQIVLVISGTIIAVCLLYIAYAKVRIHFLNKR